MTRIDAAEVRVALTREMVASHFGLDLSGRDTNPWRRGKVCPACGKAWSKATESGFCVSKQGWTCKACGGGGDLLDLVARLAGLNAGGSDFRRVLELGGDLAGVAPVADPHEREQRLARIVRENAARRAADEAAEQRRLADARVSGPTVWASLATRSEKGRRYLASRGLDGALLERAGAVRYTLVGGDPAVALYDLTDGKVWNVVRRRIEGGPPKVLGLTAHPSEGTLVGSIRDVTPGCTVVVTEGVIDSLTAVQAFPDALVLGAHGASQIAAIVREVAPRLAGGGGTLVLAPDADEPGQRAAIAAGDLALAAGLVLDATLQLLEFAGADLNAAWCAGWRP